MKLYFSDGDIKKELNKFEIEDIIFEAVWISWEEDHFTAWGAAQVDGERYSDFTVEFTTETPVDQNNLEAIIAADWDEYNFIF